MKQIPPGVYPAKILRVEPFTFRNKAARKFEPGLSVRFDIPGVGRIDEVCSQNTHHTSLLTRLLWPIAEPRGVTRDKQEQLLYSLVGASISVSVTEGKTGPVFQFIELLESEHIADTTAIDAIDEEVFLESLPTADQLGIERFQWCDGDAGGVSGESNG